MALPSGLVITPEHRAEDSCPAVINVAITFIVLETLVFIAYFVSRWIKKPTSYPILPWLMVGGYLFSCGIAVETLLACNQELTGGGHHIYLIKRPQLVRRFKISKAIEWRYIPAVTCPKFVILLLYYKILAQHRHRLRYACYAIAIAMLLLLGYGLISPALSCRPFAYNWDKTIPGGKCMDVGASYRWVSFPNIVTDILLMALCFPSIYRVQTPLIKKISLFATFGLASIGIITSILRFVEFFRTDIWADYTYNSAKPLIWSAVEPGMYLIAAALLQINPLFGLIFGGVQLPQFLVKVSSNWSKTPTKASKRSPGISREMGFELRYSDSTKALTQPEPVKASRQDGFTRLYEGQEA